MTPPISGAACDAAALSDDLAGRTDDIFSADWLRLREPFDTAARDRAADTLGLRAWAAARSARPLNVIDLASGTGSNLRYLAPRLGGEQHWRLVDHDPRLLDALVPALDRWARVHGHECHRAGRRLTVHGTGHSGQPFSAQVETRVLDLSRQLDEVPWTQAHLVTASALLDLLSAQAIDELVARGRAVGAAQCWALNVDERRVWSPADEDDNRLRSLFIRHQQRDKGFGAAVGPHAGRHVARALQSAGYRVRQAQSDWHVTARAGADHAALLAALLQGEADAAWEALEALRIGGDDRPASGPEVVVTPERQADPAATRLRIGNWLARRQSSAATHSACVGHLEVVGTL